MNSLRLLSKGLSLTFKFKGYQRTFGNSDKIIDITLSLNKILIACGIVGIGIYSYKKLIPYYKYKKIGNLYKDLFIEAIRSGDIENVKFILNKVDNQIYYLTPREHRWYDTNAIKQAIEYKQVEILKYFIDIGIPSIDILEKFKLFYEVDVKDIRHEIYKYVLNNQK